jgi:membrane fusion protein
MLESTPEPPRHNEPAQNNQPLPLFRTEVLTALQGQWTGAIRLSQSMSHWVVAAIALLLGLGVAAFIAFGSYTRKMQVTGIVTPTRGTVTISSLTAGVLMRNLVSEGAHVQPGQTLFEISSEQHGNAGELSALLGQQLSIRQQALDAERRARLEQRRDKQRESEARLTNLAAEQHQLEQEVVLATRRRALAQSTIAKYEELERSGYVSAAQVQQKVEESLDLESRLSTLQRSMLDLRSEHIGLTAQRDQLNADLATLLAQLDQSGASIRQEMAQQESRSRTLIKAPQAGVLTTITNDPGQSVTAGQVLATLIPSGGATDRSSDRLEAHLYAPSSLVGFVQLGQPVLVRYRAFPYQKFGLYRGKVSAVSRTPLAPNELPNNIASTILSYAQAGGRGAGNEGLYRVKVELAQQSVRVYGREQPLTAGMTLEADLILDHRNIWEWIFEPVMALAKR